MKNICLPNSSNRRKYNSTPLRNTETKFFQNPLLNDIFAPEEVILFLLPEFTEERFLQYLLYHRVSPFFLDMFWNSLFVVLQTQSLASIKALPLFQLLEL